MNPTNIALRYFRMSGMYLNYPFLNVQYPGEKKQKQCKEMLRLWKKQHKCVSTQFVKKTLKKTKVVVFGLKHNHLQLQVYNIIKNITPVVY